MSLDLKAKTGAFHITRWTRVCAVKSDFEDGRRALADLCDAYYEPVAAFLRAELRNADAARDMSHAFFAEMLDDGTLGRVDRELVRFRSYLLGAVKHFHSRQREAAQRLKRGAGGRGGQLGRYRSASGGACAAARPMFATRWPTCTSAASSTAISSRRTSWSATTAW